MEDNNIQFVVDENGYKHYLEKEIGRGGQGITWQTKDPNIIVKMKDIVLKRVVDVFQLFIL